LLALRQLSLTGFRNYSQRSFDFSGRVTAVCGPNGTGKTNLLDAMHYLSFTRSYFTRPDAASVEHGGRGFRIRGDWQSGSRSIVTTCILRENGRKEFQVDEVPVTRFSDHIGRLPAVFIAPDDIALVNGAPDERRRFIDTVLCQVDADYLQTLIRYTRILQQRNAHLRELSANPSMPLSLLDILDEQLSVEGTRIHRSRKAFMAILLPQVLDFYRLIAGVDEGLDVGYQSQLEATPLAGLLQEGRRLDIQLQRTRSGIHRDDLDLRLAGMPFRQTASQGQRKSLLFALKLAEYAHILDVRGDPPLLLLDDIFEKLDGGRMQNLLTWVCRENPGQVFLTDTHRDRIDAVLGQAGIQYERLDV